jgi:hypothetical protein
MWLLLVLATAGEASAQVPEDHGAGSALNPLDYDSLGAFPMAVVLANPDLIDKL